MLPKKNILVDIGHPAHVHLFRHFISEMASRGHKVFVLARNVESITRLLRIYDIPYTTTGTKPDSLFLKYLYQISIVFKTILFVRKHKIDIGIGISMTLPIVARLTGIPTIGMDDDDTTITPVYARFINKSNAILTPDALAHEKRGLNHIAYPSYHELAYLHPRRFVPDPAVLSEAGIKQGEAFYVLRFNAFKAHHDKAARGLDLEQKRRLTELLQKFGKVFITSEKQIEPEFEMFRLPVSPEKIHSLLYYSSLFVGDSQTMTSEAAMLGIPSFKCNSFAGRLSVPGEIENKYQLCFSFSPDNFEGMYQQVEIFLSTPSLKELFINRRNRMLEEKIDLTAFLSWFIETYPGSGKEMIDTADFSLFIQKPDENTDR